MMVLGKIRLVCVALPNDFKVEVFSIPWLTFANCLLHEELGVVESEGKTDLIGVVETFIFFICGVFSLLSSAFLFLCGVD